VAALRTPYSAWHQSTRVYAFLGFVKLRGARCGWKDHLQ